MIDCPCSGKHVPKPIELKEFGNLKLCPTAISNINHLLDLYTLTGGKPDGSLTKHYGKFVRDVANGIWEDTL